MAPRINWGDGSWAEVEAATAPKPAAGDEFVFAWQPGFDWGKFWNDFLWFGTPPDQLAANLDPDNYTWLGQDGFDTGKFWGTPWPGGTWDEVPAATGRVVGQAAGGTARAALDAAGAAVKGAIGEAAGDAAGDTWRTLAPWVITAGVVLVAYQVARR